MFLRNEREILKFYILDKLSLLLWKIWLHFINILVFYLPN